MNHGDLCPLPKLVEFRNRYRTPIFLEESLSFGVLGEHGRGATEHWGLEVSVCVLVVFVVYLCILFPHFYTHTHTHTRAHSLTRSFTHLYTHTAQPGDVDLVCVSLEMAVGSAGGFCAGRSYVVDHQRLSGLGYCFSASMPPMLAAASIRSLDIMESSPQLFTQIREKAATMRQLLQG